MTTDDELVSLITIERLNDPLFLSYILLLPFQIFCQMIHDNVTLHFPVVAYILHAGYKELDRNKKKLDSAIYKDDILNAKVCSFVLIQR